MRPAVRTMRMLCVLLFICYCFHTGIATCLAPQGVLCSNCTYKQCNGDSCTCAMDESGSGSEPCVNDDTCILSDSTCCPVDLMFNNVTKCCYDPVSMNAAIVRLTSTGLVSLCLIWNIL